jgi:hypothetical protein
VTAGSVTLAPSGNVLVCGMAATRHEPAQADPRVREAAARLTRQAVLIARMAADGYDTTAAEALLIIYERALAAIQASRAHLEEPADNP